MDWTKWGKYIKDYFIEKQYDVEEIDATLFFVNVEGKKVEIWVTAGYLSDKLVNWCLWNKAYVESTDKMRIVTSLLTEVIVGLKQVLPKDTIIRLDRQKIMFEDENEVIVEIGAYVEEETGEQYE